MNRLSLFLFLSLVFVWAGLCSAQTTTDKYYLINGYFFKGMPPGVKSDTGTAMIILKDGEGHNALELRLPKGKSLPEYAMKYRIPVEEVPGGEALLQLSRERKQRTAAVGGINPVNQGRPAGQTFGAELLVHRLRPVHT